MEGDPNRRAGSGQQITLLLGDCVKRLQEFPDGTVGCIVCDPPYG